MVYVQFKIKNNNGHISDLLGSDGIWILDGRYTVQRHIVSAHERKEQLKNIHPNICAYDIFQGERIANNNKLLTSGMFEMIDSRIPKRSLSVEELVRVINNNGYTKTAIERILNLEFGILNKWINGDEDISCVGLTLLRIISTYPWMLKVAENNFEENSKIEILKEVINKNKKED